MKLEGKKSLIARSLNIGKRRIVLNENRVSEIKESITRQDIKDLIKDGAINIKEKKGSLTKPKRKTRRRGGSIKIKSKPGKREYMTITRKFRSYIKNLKESGKIKREDYRTLRKQIRSRDFKSLGQLKERVSTIKQETKK